MKLALTKDELFPIYVEAFFPDKYYYIPDEIWEHYKNKLGELNDALEALESYMKRNDPIYE